MAITESEFSGILAYYRWLIEAVRRSLPPMDAAGVIRRLLDEEVLALRAAKERRAIQSESDRQRNAAVLVPRRQLG